ncbi:MAG: universal stress protein [Candidatus Acidiferrum sp.]
MLTIKKVLLPVDIPNASLGVIHQCAMLAGHFHAQVIMLHVVTALSHAAGVPYAAHKPANWDLLSVIRSDAEKQQDQALATELDGLSILRILGEGDPARAIVQAAQEENADLIMMPSHGFTFDQFLLGSVTARVLNRTECPVWTGAHLQQSLMQPFAIRNVLCAVESRTLALKPMYSSAVVMCQRSSAKPRSRQMRICSLPAVTRMAETSGPTATGSFAPFPFRF